MLFLKVRHVLPLKTAVVTKSTMIFLTQLLYVMEVLCCIISFVFQVTETQLILSYWLCSLHLQLFSLLSDGPSLVCLHLFLNSVTKINTIL